MAHFRFDVVRRFMSPLALAILMLGFISPSADAGVSSGLRNLLQGALGADLRIDSFVLDKSAVAIGETLRATVAISNQGKAAAASTLLTFWATAGSETSTSTAFRLATARLGTLQSMARMTYASTFPVPNFGRGGSYRIFATVESSATEANRQNNTQGKTVQVMGPALPDIDLTPVSDSDPSSSSPPSAGPVASSPPTTNPSPGPSAPAGSNTSPGTSSPPASSPGVGSSSPPATGSDSGSSSPSMPTEPVPQASCDYYASPTGRGNGTTSQSPFRIQDFWAVATPGATLCLLNGTYAGEGSTIHPPAGLSGSATRPITIRALNDGQVVIDGQFVRMPVYLASKNSWWVIQGINAKNGGPTGTISVVRIQQGSNNNILRRIVAWDARIDTNGEVIGIHGANGILLEDVAAFGTGRKSFSGSQGGDSVTCRRCWGRWEGSTRQGPKMTFTLVYNSYNFVCENCVAFASGESMPESYELLKNDGSLSPTTNFAVDQPFGLLATDGMGGRTNKCTNARLYGSLAVLRNTDRNIPWIGGVRVAQDVNCYHIRHTYALIPPGSHTNVRGFHLRSYEAGDIPDQTAHNITSVRASGDSFGSTFDVQMRSTGATPNSVADPWTRTDTGANLCYRWGTKIPLWPWPMNDRIKAATASAGAYSGPCPNCAGGRLGRTETDVTAHVESLLGPIPAHCTSR
jgi:hypothetical protein